jgi:hypothetical protein
MKASAILFMLSPYYRNCFTLLSVPLFLHSKIALNVGAREKGRQYFYVPTNAQNS